MLHNAIIINYLKVTGRELIQIFSHNRLVIEVTRETKAISLLAKQQKIKTKTVS